MAATTARGIEGKLARRARTIPRVVLAAIVVTAALPVLIALALLVDVVRWLVRRTPFMASRMIALAWVYLAADLVGLVVLAVSPVASAWWLPGGRARLERMTFAVQRAWTAWLFGAFKRLFALRVEVDGAEHVRATPFILLVRHVSLVDTLVPAIFVGNPHRLRMRYVLKQELLSEPCLDVAGLRLPNFFVDRDPEDSAPELAAVRALVEGLSTGEAAVIYPEGTRFRPDRLARALERLRAHDPAAYERARDLRNVLPPRPGGTLAMLDGAPDADVVVCSHHGLDGFTYLRTFWSGELLGRTISVRFRRWARASIPAEPAARAVWLSERWAEVDRWVGGKQDARLRRAS